jgi:hypothetical protein
LRKEKKLFISCILGWLLIAGGIWAYYLIKYGHLSFCQLILLHFIKGKTLSFVENFRTVFTPNLNYLLVFGTGGLLIELLKTKNNLKFFLAVFAIEHILFFGFFSGTLWPHNLIDLLFPLSVGVSYGLKELLQIFRSYTNRKSRIAYLVIPAAAFILIGAINGKNLTSGWGYLSREKIIEAASFIQANVPPPAQVLAPHYIAAEARRKKLIDYRELLGPYLWLERSIAKNGYLSFKNQTQFRTWKTMVRRTLPLWFSNLQKAVISNKVDAIVWDFVYPEWSYFQKAASLFEKENGFISDSGYTVYYQDGPYVIWLKR